jgi:hypothetical protein
MRAAMSRGLRSQGPIDRGEARFISAFEHAQKTGQPRAGPSDVVVLGLLNAYLNL